MGAYIQFRNITKKFGGTTALNQVSFDIQEGEIHCLCGENGAGKSTLINLCGGIFQPTEGQIFIGGKPVVIKTVEQSEKLGISIVHQEIPLCLNMTIAENIFLNRKEAVKGLFLDKKYMNEEAAKLLKRFQLNLKPTQLVEDLSIAEQSIIQIAMAVYYKPKILILDEATSQMDTRTELLVTKAMEEMMKGRTTFIIAHRLFTIKNADKIIFMKNGDIKEVGNHKELLELNGLYAEMYKSGSIKSE